MAEQPSLSRLWVARPLTKEERVAEIDRAEREYSRALLLDRVVTLLGCVACCLAGIACVFWALYTNDMGAGEIAFWGGLLLGDVGMLLLLLRHYFRHGT